MRRPYTEQEIATIKAMHASKKTWKEIGTAIGRDYKAVTAKFAALKKKNAKTAKPTRSYVRKISLPNKAEVTVNTHKPMIALVGTPAEVTATIRELFS